MDSFSTLPSLVEQLPRTKAKIWQTNAILPHELNASLRYPPVYLGRNFWEQVEEQLSFCEIREIPWKNLVVVKEAMAQAEELAAEITRKLEKQKKEKKTEGGKGKTAFDCYSIFRKQQ